MPDGGPAITAARPPPEDRSDSAPEPERRVGASEAEHAERRQRTETLARVARRAAHDLNNYLMVIQGALEIALVRAESDLERAIRMMKHAREGATRVAGLVAQLQLLSGVDVRMGRVHDLHRVVEARAHALRAELPESVELRIETAADVGPVALDENAIGTVVEALVRNAAEALPDGGTIRIRTQNRSLAADELPAHLAGGLYVSLRVSDTGVGMDDAVRARLFEPFFTTRGDKERGFGLVAVYGIARQMRGHVRVDSVPGSGTTVEVLLPTSGAFLEDDEPGLPTDSARAMVLLVDDDPTVREVVRDMLREGGHDVLVAPGGPEALELAEQHPAEIDLLLADVVMPDLNGPQVAERFARIRPEARVLFISGYADEVRRMSGGRPIEPFLAKPFSSQVLLAKVAEVLGNGPGQLAG